MSRSNPVSQTSIKSIPWMCRYRFLFPFSFSLLILCIWYFECSFYLMVQFLWSGMVSSASPLWVGFSYLADSEVSKTSKNRSHVYLEILLSVVAVILVLSVFIFLVHRKRKKHEQSEPSAGLECSPSCFTFLSSSIGCSSLPGLDSSSKGLLYSWIFLFLYLYWRKEWVVASGSPTFITIVFFQ